MPAILKDFESPGVSETSTAPAVVELHELQLAFIGGGIGETAI